MSKAALKFSSLAEARALAKAGAGSLAVKAEVDTEVKAGESGPITFIISTDSVDRAGDTLAVDGWDLTNYLKNPLVLWMHNPFAPPVAKATKVYVEDGKLKAQAVFASDIDPFAKTIEQMYRGGFLSATSVGFVSDEYELNKETGGIDFKAQELREFSCVTVPCNPEALVEAKAAGIDMDPLREWAAKTLERIDGSGLWVSKADAENVIRALGGTKTFSIPAPRASEEIASMKTLTLIVQVPEAKIDEAKADVEKKIKNHGGALLKSETADAANDDLASHIKAFGDMLKQHEKALKDVAAHNETLGSHVKAMGEQCADLGKHVKALKDADGDDDGDKSATDTITKGAHKLSASQMKRVKSIAKAASEIQAAHHASQGASDGEPDDGPGDNDADADKAAADVKRKAQEAEIAALLKEQKELRMRLTGKVS